MSLYDSLSFNANAKQYYKKEEQVTYGKAVRSMFDPSIKALIYRLIYLAIFAAVAGYIANFVVIFNREWIRAEDTKWRATNYVKQFCNNHRVTNMPLHEGTHCNEHRYEMGAAVYMLAWTSTWEIYSPCEGGQKGSCAQFASVIWNNAMMAVVLMLGMGLVAAMLASWLVPMKYYREREKQLYGLQHAMDRSNAATGKKGGSWWTMPFSAAFSFLSSRGPTNTNLYSQYEETRGPSPHSRPSTPLRHRQNRHSSYPGASSESESESESEASISSYPPGVYKKSK